MIDIEIFYVYLYRDEYGTPIYVGKGCRRRAWTHLYSKRKHPFIQKLQKMVREGHNPQPEFLCKDVDEEFALLCEEEAISTYGRKDLEAGTLLNLSDGGMGNSGYVHTDEARARISAARVGRALTDETKTKISTAKTGKPFTEEHKSNLATARVGRTLTDEHKRNISNSLKTSDAFKEGILKRTGVKRGPYKRRTAE